MKKFIKKSFLFAFVFTAFISGAFASSRLPNGKKPNEELMAELRGAIRFLGAYHTTGKEIESQNEARELIGSVLADKKFHDHAVLAFDDVEKEDIKMYEKVKNSGTKLEINAAIKGIKDTKTIRKQFGL